MSGADARWPAPVARGGVVAVVAPAGPPDRAGVARGVALLRSWGLEVRMGEALWDRHPSGFLAASDERRAADLTNAFTDPEVAAVVCARGGYGSQRILDRLDVGAFPAKPFVGFSDLTALHVALYQRGGLVTFHGPSLQWNEGRLTSGSAASLRAALFGEWEAVIQGRALAPGAATGPLVGGNLTILASLCGTADQLDATGGVLFCEDVSEPPYRLDRAFTQLRRAGVLDGVRGLALGGFDDCGGEAGAGVALAHAEALGVPAVQGLPLGHGVGQRTVPHGGTVTIDGGAGALRVHGPARVTR